MSAPRNLGKFFDAYADRWDAYYRGTPDQAFDYHNRQRKLLELVGTLAVPNPRVLELGCGAGHTAVMLAQGGARVTCLDVSARMIDATRANFETAGLAAEGFHVGTMTELPDDCRGYDLIVAAGVMEYVKDRDATLRSICSRLKPEGLAILSFTHSGTPLYWMEVPLKRAIALGAYVATRQHRWRDIAFPASSADTVRQVRGEFRKAGLAWKGEQFFTYGMRFGSQWFPPLPVIRRAEDLLPQAARPLLGRGFFAIGSPAP